MEPSIFALFKKITDGLSMQMNQSLKEWDLTFSQMQVLRYLYDHGGEAKQKEIENAFQVSHPTIAGLVTRLEKNGFVTTRPDTRDRRNKIVSFTDKAVAHHNVIETQKKRNDAVLLAGLNPTDQDQLRKYLLVIQNNLTHQSKNVNHNMERSLNADG